MPDILSAMIRWNAWNQAATRALAPIGITAPQAMVLMHLDTNGPSRMGDIADSLHTSRGNLTGIIERMGVANLAAASPNPDDLRSVVVAITEKGAALVPHIKAALNDVQIEAA